MIDRFDLITKCRNSELEFPSRPFLARGYIMTPKCANCGSGNLKRYNTEIAFGRGTLPPVHIYENPLVSVCLGCGRAEFVVPEAQVAELRDGVPRQPPQRVPEASLKRSKSA